MNTLGVVIKTRLEKLGKTQGWLAEELGVSNNAVSKWIGTGKISRENSIAAARVLRMSVRELLGEESGQAANDALSGDDLLRKAAEMLETYRLAGTVDRNRIDLVFREVRSHLAVDDAKSRAR